MIYIPNNVLTFKRIEWFLSDFSNETFYILSKKIIYKYLHINRVLFYSDFSYSLKCLNYTFQINLLLPTLR